MYIWAKYEKSKKYMENADILRKTERNWKFYVGKQWDAVEDSERLENLPMMNFIKPVVKYKVATIAQHNIAAIFSDVNPYHEEHTEICEKLSRLFDISYEKAKMSQFVWRELKFSAIQGDSYTFLYDTDTRTPPQNLLNTQVLLGDENITDIQEQPYIIIRERLTLDQARKRAKASGCTKKQIDMIVTDSDKTTEIYNNDEVSDKVTSLIYLEKKDGIVNIARAFKNFEYEELHPIQQVRRGEYYGKGLERYPIIPMIWEEQPNTARGVSEVEQMIPNQLEVNKTLARRSISVKQASYPKLAYDGAMIENPEDINKVGAAIKINGAGSQKIAELISYLNPASQSQDAKILSDELLKNTKDLAGASDTAMGNIDPSRVSGTAMTTIRDQQQLPLNEQVAMFNSYHEDLALLYYDMWRTFYPEGVEFDGIEITAEELDGVLPSVRIDISENNTWSRTVEQQEISNLFNNGKITLEEYAIISPDHSSVPKDKLLEIVAKRKREQEEMAMGQQVPPEEQAGMDQAYVDQQDQIPEQNVAEGLPYQELQSMLAQE